MFSQARKEDKQFLLELAELIELLAKIGTKQAIDTAESLGDTYLALEEKINTYDYSKIDNFYDNYLRNKR